MSSKAEVDMLKPGFHSACEIQRFRGIHVLAAFSILLMLPAVSAILDPSDSAMALPFQGMREHLSMSTSEENLETTIGPDLRWHFFKMILDSPEVFAKRQVILMDRIESPSVYERWWRDRKYTYEISDATWVDTLYDPSHVSNAIKAAYLDAHPDHDPDDYPPEYIAFYLHRSPKIARGRRVNRDTHTSREGSVRVRELSDSTIGVYDLHTCILAIQASGPFKPTRTTSRAIQAVFGVRASPVRKAWDTDVSCEVMRIPLRAEQAFDQYGAPVSIRLTVVRPNPRGGTDLLSEFMEQTNTQKLMMQMENRSSGVDTPRDGLVRGALRRLSRNGYLKKAVAKFRSGETVDYDKETPYTHTTSGLERSVDDGELVSLETQAPRFVGELNVHTVYCSDEEEGA